MSIESISMTRWMALFAAQANALVGGVSGLEKSTETTPRPFGWGGYISMMGERTSIRIGITSSEAGCLALAQSVLALEDDVMLPKRDIADAVCELMNMVAGKLKHELHTETGLMSLGLPVFLTEVPRTVSSLEMVVDAFNIGVHPVALLVMRFEHAARTG